MRYKYLRAVQENGPDYFLIYEGVKVFGATPIARCEKEADAKLIVDALNVEELPVYIVRRDSAEGLETDVFTDADLADEWGTYINECVNEEYPIDRGTLDDMKKYWGDKEED